MSLRILASRADVAGGLLCAALFLANLLPAAPAPGSVVTLRDGHYAKLVSANNGTASERLLVASVTAAAGDWEKFTVIDAGGGQVALRCLANNLYVCAESGGGGVLRANRSSVGPWEKFTWIDNADGSSSLLAAVNSRYACSEGSGLIANRTAIGPWEKFTVSAAAAGPVGFASVNALGTNGTTGGAGGAVVTVTTRSQLIQYASDNTPRVIQIPQGTTIDLTDGTYRTGTATVGRYNGVYYCGSLNGVLQENGGVSIGSNKTIIGLGSGANLVGHGLRIDGKSNVIVRNLTISDINSGIVEAGDAITIASSHHVWIDHCTFRNISDGMIDINGANPRYVTVSWCHFDGYDLNICSPHQHNYVSAVSTGAMVTLHNNYYDRGGGRNPRISGAGTMVHAFNNYYRNVSFYCLSSEDGAQTRLERCYYENSQRPHYYDWDLSDSAGAGALQTVVSENVYTGVSAASRREVGGSVFTPSSYYNYTTTPAADVKAAVLAGAGAGKM